MKFCIFILSLFLPIITQAASVDCKVHSATLLLNSNSVPQCQSLKVDGPYQLKLCDNDSGLLEGEDSSFRFLFMNENFWTARQDFLNYSTQIADTEIFKMDAEITGFSILKIKAKKDGTILEEFECAGTINIPLKP